LGIIASLLVAVNGAKYDSMAVSWLDATPEEDELTFQIICVHARPPEPDDKVASRTMLSHREIVEGVEIEMVGVIGFVGEMIDTVTDDDVKEVHVRPVGQVGLMVLATTLTWLPGTKPVVELKVAMTCMGDDQIQ